MSRVWGDLGPSTCVGLLAYTPITSYLGEEESSQGGGRAGRLQPVWAQTQPETPQLRYQSIGTHSLHPVPPGRPLSPSLCRKVGSGPCSASCRILPSPRGTTVRPWALVVRKPGQHPEQTTHSQLPLTMTKSSRRRGQCSRHGPRELGVSLSLIHPPSPAPTGLPLQGWQCGGLWAEQAQGSPSGQSVCCPVPLSWNLLVCPACPLRGSWDHWGHIAGSCTLASCQAQAAPLMQSRGACGEGQEGGRLRR